MAAVHRHQEVRLLGLGGHPRRWAGTLDVGDHERQLDGECKPDRLGLQVHARSARRRDGDRTPEGRAQGGSNARDLVLGLEGVHPELLQTRELVEHVARRGDGIAAEEERPLGLLRGRHEAEGGGGVPGDVAVAPGGNHGGLDGVGDREQLGVLREVVARTQGADVRVDELGGLPELLADPLLGRLDRAVVEPRRHAEAEEVAAAKDHA